MNTLIIFMFWLSLRVLCKGATVREMDSLECVLFYVPVKKDSILKSSERKSCAPNVTIL